MRIAHDVHGILLFPIEHRGVHASTTGVDLDSQVYHLLQVL